MREDGWLRMDDGMTLRTRVWRAPEPFAAFVLAHGFAEHAARHEHLATFLTELGISVYGYDQRHHGESPGKRGYITRFDRLVDDYGFVLDSVAQETGELPVVGISHSMGGLVLASHLVRGNSPLRAAVFSSPLLAIPSDVPKLLQSLASVVSALAPWLPVSTLDPAKLTRDPAVVGAYKADPLVYHGRIVARTGAEIQGAVKRVQAQFAKITLPVLIVHGTGDGLAPFEGSKLLLDGVGSEDKTFQAFEGGYHELFNDSERDMVFELIQDWLAAHFA